ncbi:MAG TPA: PBP1A family penicillin-binding protein [Thermosynergistes sp.]|nr:PBP1A family penicillin-binding protein [Thermosynergistes sp.]
MAKADAKKHRSWMRKIFTFVLLAVLLLVAAGAVSVTYFLFKYGRDLPTFDEMVSYEPNLSTVIYDRNGREIARLFRENRTWVRLEEISPWMIKATMAAEDSSFYKHHGVDISGIIRALWVNFRRGEAMQGGSTITQQLARNLFLTLERTLDRKIKETILALRMERIFSKDQILEMYLNTIYFGHGAYGVFAASQQYYGKKPSELSLAESAMLAGLIAAPERFTPLRHPEEAKARQAYVLRRLVELEWISAKEGSEALAQKLTFASKKAPTLSNNKAPYFVSYILFGHLLPRYGGERVYQGGLRVYTTLDLTLQEKADKIIQKLSSEGAIVALDPATGEILTMVGGKNFEKSKFNRAIQAYRQPGSAFKPFIYSAALESGIRFVDHLLDAPLVYENGWAPTNYDDKFHGEVTALEALIHSYNVVAIRVAEIVGLDKVKNLARRVGITSPYLPYDLSIALGSGSVTPMEMAIAYACFANGGYRIKPFAIKEIRDREGVVLESNGPVLEPALDPIVSMTMLSALKDVVLYGTGRPARIEGYETFGKTGTTNEWSDAWFVGGVPGLVAVVYAGHDDHKPLGDKATGGRIAAPVWKEFVSTAVKDLNLPKSFMIKPEYDVEEVTVCRYSGFLAAPNCPRGTLILQTGSAPLNTCLYHGGMVFAGIAEDPNAPRLLLAPQDYAYMASGQAAPELSAPSIAAPSAASLPQASKGAAPPSPQEKPYKKDPSPPDEVERRFQELLKEYGLVN